MSDSVEQIGETPDSSRIAPEEPASDAPDPLTDAAGDEIAQGVDEVDEAPPVGVSTPDYPPLQSSPDERNTLPLSRFYDVSVTVSVELGRVQVPLGRVLQLGEGAVVELDREVTDPVDLLAQGVRLGRGEVVIVNDQYAVRITELESVPGGATAAHSSASAISSTVPADA